MWSKPGSRDWVSFATGSSKRRPKAYGSRQKGARPKAKSAKKRAQSLFQLFMSEGERMNSTGKKQIEKLAIAHGLRDFKWMNPNSIILGHWVRMKCSYGCPGYGKRKTCPPYVPSVEECIKFFREYKRGLFFHFAKKLKDPEMRHPWSKEVNQRMLDLEREVFLSGYQKAFVFPQAPCRLCKNCTGSAEEGFHWRVRR